jgi:hypothetical protein
MACFWVTGVDLFSFADGEDTLAYRHTQAGWVTLWSLGGSSLLILYLMRLEPSWIPLPILGILILAMILFASLTVIGNSRFIEVRFGPGLIRKRIGLDDIESCRSVQNHWWYGWGIRRLLKGWMFNVSGLDAVELSLKKGGTFTIGTDEPEILERFIKGEIEKRRR